MTVTETLEGRPSGIADHAMVQNVLGVLQPGETFQLDVNNAPRYGCTRQGGCNEINTIDDPVLGRCIEMTTNDNDHTLPGTNSPPLGGCYAVHRVGGVAACLIAPVKLPHDQLSFVRLKVAIPSKQGLSGGFPQSMQGKWLSVHENYGPPFAGSGVTGLAVAKHYSTGANSWLFGPGAQKHSFWVPFALDKWFDFVFAIIPSTDPNKGQVSVICNGQPVKSWAGNDVEKYATLTAADWGGGVSNPGNLLSYAQNYRSLSWGGTLRVLFQEHRIGSSLASVSGGSVPSPTPTPTPTPGPTPTPTGSLTLSTAQIIALRHYISAHGVPTGVDHDAILSIWKAVQ